MTALGTVATVATLFTGLYPRVMVSSTDFANSLDVSGAASAHYTLAVMTVVALIVLPIVLLYQSWSYYVFRARVTRRGDPAVRGDPAIDRRLDGRLIVRVLDQRLVRRARPGAPPARAGHGPSVPCPRGSSSLQAVLIARIVAQAFSGALAERCHVRPRPARARVRRAERPDAGASRSPAAAPRRRSSPSFASSSSSAGSGTSRSRSTAPRRARSRRRPCRASTGSRPTSPATCRRSCSRSSSRWPCSGSPS